MVSVRLVAVAEALTITRPAACRDSVTARVSPENVGPTTPLMEESLMKRSLAVVAWSGAPWVSKGASANLTSPPAALASSMATSAP